MVKTTYLTLAEKYAKRFCAENPNITFIDGRKMLEEAHKRGCLCLNNRFLGPIQVWPVQIDSFSFRVLERYGDKEASYSNLKHIIFLESPGLENQSYLSMEEYQHTIMRMFEAAIYGMKNARIRKKIDEQVNEVIDNKNAIVKFFTRKERVRKQVIESPLIAKMITKFKERVPEHMDCPKNWGLG